ncbi:formimidoylglutamate deiminase [Haloechinothrix sp. LS1_15]|uniref:formimidoylglutamate deiminase n=1 Tax=Haloechinothrix sp. LS1_15 TaxID=2652248 RepID=UPI0029477718|nr:formimidoylglutamate deiminase [Haloechinothrix sp. LS1_15]MDV6014563.1 formimidoylglutamate deiminase [Haloechinothrix sp. LS1_15]
MSRTYWCEHAWLPEGPVGGVSVTVDDGRITAVQRDAPRSGTVLAGMVMPGMANAHSHAFHRALRGRTHAGGGTFWTWRERMYRLAERIDPDQYYRLARAVYAEMLLAGYTAVGEFHYLHHDADGSPYADPHAMSSAIVAAAVDAGIRLTLLDACYLAGGVGGAPMAPVQRRFADADADAWAQRASGFDPGSDQVRLGAAVHSLRAVPVEQVPVIVAWARQRDAPLHAHLSEQRGENETCHTVYGRSPTELFAEAGALDERFVAVHATHTTGLDITWLGSSGAWACLCPTTEQDLGDGIGPARSLANAGCSLALGSDSHAVVDALAELRGLEMAERLAAESRGRFSPHELVTAGAAHGAIGWPEAGRIATGAIADLVRVSLDSVRTAGCDPAGIPLCATAADVRDVMVGGRWMVRQGNHLGIDTAAELDTAIRELTA